MIAGVDCLRGGVASPKIHQNDSNITSLTPSTFLSLLILVRLNIFNVDEKSLFDGI
jgi:hypothetical protein